MLPQIVSHILRGLTGIEIHPAAQIGHGLRAWELSGNGHCWRPRLDLPGGNSRRNEEGDWKKASYTYSQRAENGINNDRAAPYIFLYQLAALLIRSAILTIALVASRLQMLVPHSMAIFNECATPGSWMRMC